MHGYIRYTTNFFDTEILFFERETQNFCNFCFDSVISARIKT